MVLVVCRRTLSPTIQTDAMADLSIQFHALPAEAIQFALDVVRDFDVSPLAIRVRPFGAQPIDDPNELGLILQEGGVSRVVFCFGKPSLLALDESGFIKLNPDSLRLDIGKLTEQGLRQSWLSARTENREAMALWKKIAARLRSATNAGAMAINPATGAKCVIKDYRYTANAKIMSESGLRMLPIAGSSILKFGQREGG